MYFDKVLYYALFAALLILLTAQKSDKKDTAKTDAAKYAIASVGDTNATRPPLSKDQEEAIKANASAVEAGNNRIRALKKEDIEEEKQQVAMKSMAQAIKSLTYENVGYRQEIGFLKEDNGQLKEQLQNALAQLLIKPDTVVYILKPIWKGKRMTGYEKIRQ